MSDTYAESKGTPISLKLVGNRLIGALTAGHRVELVLEAAPIDSDDADTDDADVIEDTVTIDGVQFKQDIQWTGATQSIKQAVELYIMVGPMRYEIQTEVRVESGVAHTMVRRSAWAHWHDMQLRVYNGSKDNITEITLNPGV